MTGVYLATINGKDCGQVYKARNRWRWARGPVAVETYPRLTQLDDIRDHIARLNRVAIEHVQLTHLPANYRGTAIAKAEGKS